eukprot:2755272-Rhodomonas_salina.1
MHEWRGGRELVSAVTEAKLSCNGWALYHERVLRPPCLRLRSAVRGTERQVTWVPDRAARDR